MNRPTSARRRRAGPRGQISWVTLLLLLGLAAAGYLTFVWFPLYVVHYEVKQVVRDHMNQAIKNPNDRELVSNMAQKLRTLDQLEAEDEQGRPIRIPAVQLDESEVVWERDASAEPPTLHVAFEYLRVVTYPGLDREAEKLFTVDLTQSLERPDWGPAR